ncbi:MAG: SH3 domain-containing protein [Caldilineaceae bacterium]|nr:SH3 domain-containing protein [Caldilineaceae bacterium]
MTKFGNNFPSVLPKQLWLSALLFGLFLTWMPQPAAARASFAPPQQADSNFTATITADRLNVRSGPGTQHATIAKLTRGAQVNVTDQTASGDWFQVTLPDGTNGWIAAAYATHSGGSRSTAAVPPLAVGTADTTSATTATATSTTATAYTIPARINIRRGPGTNYAIATSVSAGTALEILALNPAGDWYQVQLAGQAEPVWVFASLTRTTGTLDGVARLTADQLPAAPVAATATTATAAASVNAPPPSGGGFFAYGIQVNAWQGDKAGSAAMTREIGFPWVKQQVRWEFVENSPGAVDWSEMDQILDAMTGNGLQVLFSVVTAPQWTRPDKPGTGGPPNDFNLFANFVGQIAGRYCGRLGAIEVWNEQNLQREWEGFPLDPALYMDLLRRSYSAIKAACPGMIVVSGATTPTGNSPIAVDDIDYLRGMYNHGLANYSDAIGIHPSGYGNPPNVTIQDWQAGTYNAPSHVNHRSFYFRSTMEESRQVMVAYGDVNKRLWLTEFGWASSVSPHPGYEYAAYNSEAQQAQYIVDSYQMMRNWGWVGVAFLWNLNYTHGEMGQFSVIGRPAYEALKGLPR